MRSIENISLYRISRCLWNIYIQILWFWEMLRFSNGATYQLLKMYIYTCFPSDFVYEYCRTRGHLTRLKKRETLYFPSKPSAFPHSLPVKIKIDFPDFRLKCRFYRLVMGVDAKKEPIWDTEGRERSLVEIGDSHKDAWTENEWENAEVRFLFISRFQTI